MIETPYCRCERVPQGHRSQALQQYVQALLARQKAQDLLESLHQQINHAWSNMRRLLEGLGFPQKANKAARLARAAQASLAREAYRALAKRGEECIAALHDAERRAHAAWQSMLSADSQVSIEKSPRQSAPSKARGNGRSAWRSDRRRKSSIEQVNSTLQLA